MRGHELRVEQLEAAGPEPGDKMRQRHFRGVPLTVEHALAEERPAQRDAIQAADESPLAAAFDRMDEAHIEQFAIEAADLRIDPGLFAIRRRRGAGVDHRVEIPVDGHLEPVRAHRLGQRARDDESVERKDRALLGIDPEKLVVFGAFGHRKKADGIGAQQKVRSDCAIGAGFGHDGKIAPINGFLQPRRSNCHGCPAEDLCGRSAGMVACRRRAVQNPGSIPPVARKCSSQWMS